MRRLAKLIFLMTIFTIVLYYENNHHAFAQQDQEPGPETQKEKEKEKIEEIDFSQIDFSNMTTGSYTTIERLEILADYFLKMIPDGLEPITDVSQEIWDEVHFNLGEIYHSLAHRYQKKVISYYEVEDQSDTEQLALDRRNLLQSFRYEMLAFQKYWEMRNPNARSGTFTRKGDLIGNRIFHAQDHVDKKIRLLASRKDLILNSHQQLLFIKLNMMNSARAAQQSNGGQRTQTALKKTIKDGSVILSTLLDLVKSEPETCL